MGERLPQQGRSDGVQPQVVDRAGGVGALHRGGREDPGQRLALGGVVLAAREAELEAAPGEVALDPQALASAGHGAQAQPEIGASGEMRGRGDLAVVAGGAGARGGRLEIHPQRERLRDGLGPRGGGAGAQQGTQHGAPLRGRLLLRGADGEVVGAVQQRADVQARLAHRAVAARGERSPQPARPRGLEAAGDGVLLVLGQDRLGVVPGAVGVHDRGGQGRARLVPVHRAHAPAARGGEAPARRAIAHVVADRGGQQSREQDRWGHPANVTRAAPRARGISPESRPSAGSLTASSRPVRARRLRRPRAGSSTTPDTS